MLTTEQKATLKAYIEADPVLSTFPNNSDGWTDIANKLNLEASPAFYVWKKSLSRHEIIANTSEEGTTFSWAGGAYITRSQGERDAFREMFNSSGNVDQRKASIMAAFNDIFSGAGGAGNRTHITAISKRRSSVVEKVLATGTGSLVSPATAVFDGPISLQDVGEALNP